MDNAKPGPKKILVIDDEGDLLKLAKTRIELNGYKVITLGSGARALEVAKSEKPDLILLDVLMPGKSGVDVCKDLKTDSATRGIPIIMFTAHYPEEEYLKINIGETAADDFILKPFEPEVLLSKIKFLIK